LSAAANGFARRRGHRRRRSVGRRAVRLHRRVRRPSDGVDGALVGGEPGADGDGVMAAGGDVGVAVERDATLGFAGGFIASRM